jgi:hypothetical protein
VPIAIAEPKVPQVAPGGVWNALRAPGCMKDPREWDDATAAAVASIEIVEEFSGTGADRKLVGHTKKVKLWDKNAALEKALKHLGLYERDNTQRSENLSLQVLLWERRRMSKSDRRRRGQDRRQGGFSARGLVLVLGWQSGGSARV